MSSASYHLDENRSSICRLNSTTVPTLRTKAQLNKVITNVDGSPDHLAINIYFDSFRSWYKLTKVRNETGKIIAHRRKLKTKGIYTNYNKLIDLHGVSKETIRRKLVKLEKLGLISRSFEHKHNAVTDSYNHLIVYVWTHTPHFFNNLGIAREEVGQLSPHTNYEYVEEKFGVDFESKNQVRGQLVRGEGIHRLEDTKKLNILPEGNINRSMKSNFLNKLFLEKISSKKLKREEKHNFKDIRTFTACKLGNFYPLSDSDVSQLQLKSGRNFTKRAMNEILKDMAKRVTAPEFYSKKGFIAYMSKVFMHEKRNESLVAGDSFYIKNNLSEEEHEIISQEKYLSEIESSLEVNPEAHLKKKLAAVLESNKACRILKGWKSAKRVGDIFEITLNKPVDLTRMDREIIHNSVLATAPLESGETILGIERTEISMPEVSSHTNSTSYYLKRKKKNDPENYMDNALPNNAWGRIRKRIITDTSTDMKNGIGVDSSWFARLHEEIDEQKKQICLRAPTVLVKDWITNKYMDVLSKAAVDIGYCLKQIE